MLHNVYVNTHIEAINNYYDIYFCVFKNLQQLFILFEKVLFYKYFVYNNDYEGTPNLKLAEYNMLFNFYLSVLKTILHFIWSFEYNVLKDKTKLTKFHVIDDEDLEFGYHIYLKDKANYNPYDSFNETIKEEDYMKKINNKYNSDKYQLVYESILTLSNLINLAALSNNGNNVYCIYMKCLENKELKNLDYIFSKTIPFLQFDHWYENDVRNLKKEIRSHYFLELVSILNVIYKD